MRNSLKRYDKENQTSLFSSLVEIKVITSGIVFFIKEPAATTAAAGYQEAVTDFLKENELDLWLLHIVSIPADSENKAAAGDTAADNRSNSTTTAGDVNVTGSDGASREIHKTEKTLDIERLKKGLRVKIPGVKRTIMVVSGKGGVGKSSLTVQLAAFMADKKYKYKVALLDADIHGPSLGRMLGADSEPLIKDNTFIPLLVHNIKLMSTSLFNKGNEPLIWRGPMISGMLHQILYNSEWRWSKLLGWQDSDYLLIDTPPGTGDIHLSLVEKYDIDAAILVSTGQQVALDATHKSFLMLRKMGVEIIGIVENMMLPTDDAEDDGKGDSVADTAREASANQPKVVENDGRISRPETAVTRYAAAQDHLPYLGYLPFVKTLWQELDAGRIDMKHEEKFSQEMQRIVKNVISFFDDNN